MYDDQGTATLADDTVTIVKHVVYDAFGNVIDDTAPGVESLVLYTARPFDAETGLQNNLHRWYDPAVGRWLAEDPIGFAGDVGNLYRYCGNAATFAIDPSGLVAWSTVPALVVMPPSGSGGNGPAAHARTGSTSIIWDLLRGAGNALVEMKAYFTDVVIITIDTVGEVSGGWDFDIDESSRYGQATRFDQPDYNNRYRVIEETVGRAGCAGLTLGGSEIYFGVNEYLRTGDDVALREHIGGVVAGNAIAAGAAKAPPVFRPVRPAVPVAPKLVPPKLVGPKPTPSMLERFQALAENGPTVGGGARLENLSAAEQARMQAFANRYGAEVTNVGSRAGGTASPMSDFDYIISGNSRLRADARAQLPRGAAGGEIGLRGETGIDIFNGNKVPLDPTRPHIIFRPTPKQGG